MYRSGQCDKQSQTKMAPNPSQKLSLDWSDRALRLDRVLVSNQVAEVFSAKSMISRFTKQKCFPSSYPQDNHILPDFEPNPSGVPCPRAEIGCSLVGLRGSPCAKPPCPQSQKKIGPCRRRRRPPKAHHQAPRCC